MEFNDPDRGDVVAAARILSKLPTVTEAVPEHDRVELQTDDDSHRGASFIRGRGKEVYDETGCIITGVRQHHGEDDVLAVWLDEPVDEDESEVPDDVDVFSFLAGVFVANVMNNVEPTKNVEHDDSIGTLGYDESAADALDDADVDADEIVEELSDNDDDSIETAEEAVDWIHKQHGRKPAHVSGMGPDEKNPYVMRSVEELPPGWRRQSDGDSHYLVKRDPASTDEAMAHLDPQFEHGEPIHSTHDEASIWVYAPDTDDADIDLPYGWEITAHGNGGVGFARQ